MAQWQWQSKFTIKEVTTDNGNQVNEYYMMETIGKGTFAKVKLCERRAEGSKPRRFAAKIMSKPALQKLKEYVRVGETMRAITALDKVEAEVDIMSTLYHRNLVLLFEVINDPESDNIYLVLEHMPKGPSMVYDQATKSFKSPITGGILSEDIAKQHIRDIVQGVKYLHSRGISHRDIKPDNILLNDDNRCHLSDFGCAQVCQPNETITSTLGTFQFLAPECCSGVPFSPFQADTWAIGVTLFAYLFGSLLFESSKANDLFERILQEPVVFPSTSSELSSLCMDFLESALNKDPAERLTISLMETHPWLAPDYHIWEESMTDVSRAALITAALKGINAVKELVEDNLGSLNNLFRLIIDAQDIPTQLKRSIWSGMVLCTHRFGILEKDFILKSLRLLGIVESDRYVVHLAKLALQQHMDLLIDPDMSKCVIASIHVKPKQIPPEEIDMEVIEPEDRPTKRKKLDVHGMDEALSSTMEDLEEKMEAVQNDLVASIPVPVEAETPKLPQLPNELLEKGVSLAKEIGKVSGISTAGNPTLLAALDQICQDAFKICTDLLQDPLCDPNQMQILCKTMQLSKLPDDAILTFTTTLMEAKWASRYASVCLEHSLLIKVVSSSTTLSRTLHKALHLVGTNLPQYSIRSIIVPILCGSEANAPQYEAMTRLIREGLKTQYLNELVDQLALNGVFQTTQDKVLLVVQQIFNLKASLTQDVMDHVVQGLVDAKSTDTLGSTKFASILFTIVSKYGSLCVCHRSILLSLATKCTSSMAKTAQRAIEKLV